ncbi:uncharacterized protein PV09_04287 [Verruconis gallopava]|uniref:Glycosyl transferase CAP10 domain-containing protein n=1 Tax=Verruconis gallopava TaxID=253628 RepID=A0A0D2ACF1_9PEZI|nr:uncharacterized protein PV09_04287 [Verruconis gallopava]KIW04533.1 hypothetical protein PV09_04287 [Verruconis gallopava]
MAGPSLANGFRTWLRSLHASSRARYLAVAAFVSLALIYFSLYTSSKSLESWHNVDLPGSIEHGELMNGKHPIDDLILSARAQYYRTLNRRSYNVQDAAKKYRARRGRHPPPGFDEWFEYAKSKDAVIVEEFFDRIYHDLTPFWAIDPKVLRFQANAYDFVISVRRGNATFKTDTKKRVPWIQLWHGLIAELQHRLPDVDVPVNMMDESRVVVPWEEMEEYMRKAELKRFEMDPVEVISNFTGLTAFDADKSELDMHYDPQFHGGQYWELAKIGCHPNSTSRNEPAWTPLEEPTLLPRGQPQNSVHGFVGNWTLAKQICDKPYLRGLHGSFIEPVSVSTTHQLIPMFGGSKLPVNNEILLPPATYLNADPLYSGGKKHGSDWSSKKEKVYWRGVASGGRNRAENWIHFQRHRFVQMMNGTRVLQAEQTRIRGETFDLPRWDDFNIKAIRNGYLGDWVSEISDVSFIDLLCFPHTDGRNCPYTDPYFSTQDGVPMEKMYKHKYLPDIDGNSFSGRYRAFLKSTSVPIKATIYEEWHDDRLFPWVHFIPMDNTFIDIYGILDYFMGFNGLGSHDDVAKQIADDGRSWAEKTLRREDMGIYTYRLLLEWARLCDDNRVSMGWVEDLLGAP